MSYVRTPPCLPVLPAPPVPPGSLAAHAAAAGVVTGPGHGGVAGGGAGRKYKLV